MKYSNKEVLDISKAWFAISLAFAIVMAGFSFTINFLISFIIAGLSVGVGFIFHELAHKFVAQNYNYYAEFRSFDTMLILAVLMSFFGFIIAAPGAVMIRGNINFKNNGKISAAGIVASLIVAVIFLFIYFAFDSGIINIIGRYGLVINSWLAIFNLIPVANLDGVKVLRWNRGVYFSLALVGIILLFYGWGLAL